MATFTIEEVGADVRVTASGTLSVTGLAGIPGTGWGVLDPSAAFLTVGPPQANSVPTDGYAGSITGPASFGSSSGFLGASSTTSPASIVGFGGGYVYTPVGFVSGSAISGSSTFANQSFTSLGLTAGNSYTWTLPNDTIIVQIGPATPPPPPPPVSPIPTLSEWAQILMMLSMIGMAGWYGRRMTRG